MTFTLSKQERLNFEKWDKKHLEDVHGGVHPYCGAAGGRLHFVFSPNGLGTAISVYCGVCDSNSKNAENITDYGCW